MKIKPRVNSKEAVNKNINKIIIDLRDDSEMTTVDDK